MSALQVVGKTEQEVPDAASKEHVLVPAYTTLKLSGVHIRKHVGVVKINCVTTWLSPWYIKMDSFAFWTSQHKFQITLLDLK